MISEEITSRGRFLKRFLKRRRACRWTILQQKADKTLVSKKEKDTGRYRKRMEGSGIIKKKRKDVRQAIISEAVSGRQLFRKSGQIRGHFKRLGG